MKTRAHLSVGGSLTWLAVLLALVLSAGVGQAAERLTIPDEYSNLPYYARLMRLVGTETWAVAFYRPPDCVPDSFNLHDFFDFDLDYDMCPFLMEGFAIWKDQAGVGGPPLQQALHDVKGTPVPIWFVSEADMLGALLRDDDGVPGPDLIVTVPDLAGMSSLQRGWADSYQEQLRPTGGAEVPTATYVASGILEDARSFFMLYTWTANTGLTEAIVRFSD